MWTLSTHRERTLPPGSFRAAGRSILDSALEHRAYAVGADHPEEGSDFWGSFDLVRWGLIPFWSRDRSIETKTINAMSETAAEKPAFRDALRLRRRLIPADGFYEWQSSDGKQKQPFSIGMADDSLFAFAGL